MVALLMNLVTKNRVHSLVLYCLLYRIAMDGVGVLEFQSVLVLALLNSKTFVRQAQRP
jgi:hypothetical protein